MAFDFWSLEMVTMALSFSSCFLAFSMTTLLISAGDKAREIKTSGIARVFNTVNASP